MNKYDLEFWNGFLKGLISARQEIEPIMEKTPDSEGVRTALSAIDSLKSRVEGLHGEDVRNFLRQWK